MLGPAPLRRSTVSRHRSLGRRHHSRRHRPSHAGRDGRRPALWAAVAIVAFGVFVAVQELRPVPRVALNPAARLAAVNGSLSLPWPKTGEAALAVGGVGLVGAAGPQSPAPIASITKVMTALVVLDDRPLSPGSAGPTITITPAEVAQYRHDLATQQSVAAVAAGERLTEYQALEALLIPSANNIADALASFAAGTQSRFVAQMNREARALGLSHTHFVEPSGLDPRSVSTPRDLVRLGEAAMGNPVIAAIVRMPAVTLPVAGMVVNYDYDIGHDGFIGIKTGSDGPAGGCFLFENVRTTAAGTTRIFGAVLGQQAPPIVQSALNASDALARALGREVAPRVVVRRGETVGSLAAPWGTKVPLVAAQALTVAGWPGLAPRGAIDARSLGFAVRAGERVGTLVVSMGGRRYRVPLEAGGNLASPGFGYRLTRW